MSETQSAAPDGREIDCGTQELLCRVEERAAVLTLNRPDARNALSLELKRALSDALDRLAADDGVGCVLLTGAGRAFCAGGDTKLMAREGRPPSAQERLELLRWEHGIPARIHRMDKPVVASLPGPAAGELLRLPASCWDPPPGRSRPPTAAPHRQAGESPR